MQCWKYNDAAGRKYVTDSEGALASALCNYWANDSALNTVPIPLDVKDLCKNSHKSKYETILPASYSVYNPLLCTVRH